MQSTWASQVSTRVKNLPANAGVIRDVGSIPGLGRPPGGRHGNPLQYSRLENTMDRGAWQAAIHSTAESDTTKVTVHTCRGVRRGLEMLTTPGTWYTY